MGGKIYEAIPAIMADMGAIGKDRRNDQGKGFMYRGIDDVMNALSPLLTKHKIFIYPEILEQSREERTSRQGSNLIYSICKIKYHVCADDGSSIESVVTGEGMDSGDKATNKAMSVAFKYLCFQLFCIPTEEMVDPDAESHDVQPRDADRSAGRNATSRAQKAPQNAAKTTIGPSKASAIRSTIKKKGLHESQLLTHYHVSDFAQMTFDQWNNAMQILEKYPDKE